MLVLSRVVGESIVLDGGIEVTFVSIDRNKIKLGINAPKSVRIMRKELLSKASNNGHVEEAPCSDRG